jgi:hypothetical protein
VLQRHADLPLRVFVVWEPILPTDTNAPDTPVLQRMADSRVQQYWDPDHLVAKQLAKDARPPQPVQECCVRDEFLWDLAAMYAPGVSWTDRVPPAILFNGPVVDVAEKLDGLLANPATVGVAMPPPSLPRDTRTAADAHSRPAR